MSKKVIVIGAGFSGLSVATCLAQEGYDVTILEKHATAGGRARQFSTVEGFVFDMGPSWYWMPDVFEKYFALFGKKVSDYYDLRRIDPSYRVVFGQDDQVDVPAQIAELEALFEKLEPGSVPHLRKFLEEAKYKYEVGMNEFVYKPGRSLMEFAEWRVLKSLFRLQMLKGMAEYVEELFKSRKIREILKFPVLFLGATPENTPAMYSLMNYADLVLGTWYPMGGMFKIIEGMESLAREMGVKFMFNQDVRELIVHDGRITQVRTADAVHSADIIVASADYRHVEQELLPASARTYSAEYWEQRTMAPSSLLFYLGVNRRVEGLLHHNLFFDKDFNQHAHEIYTEPRWPSAPLFYASAPSKTDSSVAPDGCENLFVLIPTAHSLEDNDDIREYYYNMVMERLEAFTGQDIRSHVIYKRSYAHRDFAADYNAFKSNAYGLANTLSQTAMLKPALKSKHVTNLYYTGQLTVPGPGVPPSLISGQVVAAEISKDIPLPKS